MVDMEDKFLISNMKGNEQKEVAELIHHSTNSWYLNNGKEKIFCGPPEDTLLFCEVYEALDLVVA